MGLEGNARTLIRSGLGILLFLSLVGTPLLAQAGAGDGAVVGGPPRPPSEISTSITAASNLSGSSLALPPLKAILLVGPIDGDTGSWTLQEIANMELAATVLQANGVEVHKFYPGGGHTFAQIDQAAQGAHFLLYRGHGVYSGSSAVPTLVGGFWLNNGTSAGWYTPDRIRSSMRLAPNAIVMLYGCFTAGTSGSDGRDIGLAEAQRRVAMYSDAFLDIGAGGYFANWFGNAFQQYLHMLFQGYTQQQAYEAYFDFNSATVYRTMHPHHPSSVMWLDKDYWSGYWQYNNAFVGQPTKTLRDLFVQNELGGIPSSVSFVAEVNGSTTLLAPNAYTVTPMNSGSATPLTWTVTSSGDWFVLDRTNGTTPQGFTITPSGFPATQPAQLTGAVTVTVTAPQGTLNAVQRINLSLEVRLPKLDGLPTELRFIYSRTSKAFLIADYRVAPMNPTTSAALTWAASSSASWIRLSGTSGTTPSGFVVTAEGFSVSETGVYNGAITVNAVAPSNTQNCPQTIPVVLTVTDRTIEHVFLPLVSRSYASP